MTDVETSRRTPIVSRESICDRAKNAGERLVDKNRLLLPYWITVAVYKHITFSSILSQ